MGLSLLLKTFNKRTVHYKRNGLLFLICLVLEFSYEAVKIAECSTQSTGGPISTRRTYKSSEQKNPLYFQRKSLPSAYTVGEIFFIFPIGLITTNFSGKWNGK